ncbi:unnamed protein product [Peronospora belbahrii]|uniref:Uncharacterized protein n=1 Tax=Peronospora belbahrii TaxID=622444 RepID=A0AAU9L4E2_9STRA|nr:unnamed protein product [Peronospora belbahrii]
MDFFNKAKQAAEKYIIEDSSSSNNYKKKSDTGSLLTKAKDAAEKYHAKEKAAEYAQKRVAKRNGDNRDKSAVSKAMEATEDFFREAGSAQV